MIKSILNIFLLGLVLVAGISACNDAHDSSAKNPVNQASDVGNSVIASNAIEVQDFKGNTVRLERPAQRIVTLAPHIVENAYSAGAGAQLVGAVEWSNFPEQAKELAIVGGYQKINYERILELNPDLVIAWESGNAHASVAKLTELGLTVYIDQADTLQDVAKSIRDIGVLSGHAQYANKAADDYLTELSKFQARYKDAAKVSVFYQVWNSPLQSINGNHIISDAIEICGGENIYADEIAVAPMINIESVLERNPTAIIASGVSSEPPSWLADWNQWPSLIAVQNKNLFFVNPDHLQRHTTRLLLGLSETCRQLDLARLRSNAN